MRRPFVTMTALALALLPVATFAQTPPPVQQPPATAAPPTPTQPAAPKLTFKSPTGMLLVTVKADQTAAFEEMIAKMKGGAAASTDASLKAGANVKMFKSADPGAGGNAFYVLLYDSVVPGTEYSWLDIINKTLTDEQKRDPATQEMYKRFAAAIVSTNILNLAEVK